MSNQRIGSSLSSFLDEMNIPRRDRASGHQEDSHPATPTGDEARELLAEPASQRDANESDGDQPDARPERFRGHAGHTDSRIPGSRDRLQKENLQAEIAGQRATWTEEKQAQLREQREPEEALKKQRQRENDEYEYKKGLERRRRRTSTKSRYFLKNTTACHSPARAIRTCLF